VPFFGYYLPFQGVVSAFQAPHRIYPNQNTIRPARVARSFRCSREALRPEAKDRSVPVHRTHSNHRRSAVKSAPWAPNPASSHSELKRRYLDFGQILSRLDRSIFELGRSNPDFRRSTRTLNRFSSDPRDRISDPGLSVCEFERRNLHLGQSHSRIDRLNLEPRR